MDTLVFDGQTYARRNERWMDSGSKVVPGGLQKDFNYNRYSF